MHLGAGVFEQLPVLPPSTFDEMWTAVQLRHPLWKWLLPRVIELSYTAWDIQPFARDCGWSGPPFRWDEERRFLLRCELDAAFFHLYLGREEEWKRQGTLDLLRYFPTPRHAVDYIMDTFPIVKRRDEQAHGRYRTKETILEIYDNMARMMIENAAVTSAGQQPTACYQTRLDPPPGPLCDAQGNFIPMEHWYAANWPAHIHMPRAKEVPVAAAQAIAEQVEEGLAVLYALALLHTWGKPADRRSFELAMILMEKDALRERILKRKPTIALPQAQPVSVRLGNIDEFLAELAGSDTLRVTNAKGRQIVALGPNAPTRATLAHGIAGTDAFAKAQQTLEAISILEEQNSSLELFMGASDYGAITIALP